MSTNLSNSMAMGCTILRTAGKAVRGWRNRLSILDLRGVGVVMEGNWKGERGEGRSAYLDTAELGAGITFALIYDSEALASGTAKTGENEEPFNKFAQYAIVARDLKK